MAIDRRLPESVQDVWGVIVTAQGWPLRKTAGMGLSELMACEERAVAVLKAGGGR